MAEKELFDHWAWVKIATNVPELSDELEGVAHIADRFVGQYLPVLLRSRTKEDSDHVWLAFWNYLVAPRTTRKPFGLTGQTADNLIAEFQKALSELG